MISVPEEIKELYKQDSISKNFRVHFVNGEYRDLVNADFVSESVVFTESVSSNGNFRFGTAEGSSIEFQTYFNVNITNCVIACFSEIDISSLDEDVVTAYGITSSDVPFPYFPVPYGYFIVNSAKKTGVTNVRKIIAYQPKFQDLLKRAMYTPDTEFAKLVWGVVVKPARGAGSTIDTDIGKDGLNYFDVGIPYFKFYASTIKNCSVLGKPSAIFDSDSSVFTLDGQFNQNQMRPTIKVCTFYNAPAGTPIGEQMAYKVMIKGHVIVFGDNRYSYFDQYNDTFKAELSGHKQLADLPYFLDATKNDMYELTWKNSLSMPTLVDFNGDTDVYNAIKDELKNLCKPCMRFCDWSTPPWTESGDLTTSRGAAYTFPLGATQNAKDYMEITDYTGQFIRYDEYNGYTRRYRVRDFINDIYPDTKFAHTSSVDKSGTYCRLSNGKTYHHFNSGLSQNYIDIEPITTGNEDEYKLVIDPEIFKMDVSDYQKLRQLDKYNEYIGLSRGNPEDEDVDYIGPTVRNRHIEICIPTEIVVAKAKFINLGEDNVAVPQIIQGFRTMNESDSDIQSSTILTDCTNYTVNINEFKCPKLYRYQLTTETLRLGTIDFKLHLVMSTTGIAIYDTEVFYYYIDGRGNMIDNSYVFSAYAPYHFDDSGNIITLTSDDLLENYYTEESLTGILSSRPELLGVFLRPNRQSLYGVEVYFPTLLEPISYPSDDVYPDDNIFPINAGYIISRSMWRKLLAEDRQDSILYDKVVFKGEILKQQVEISADIDIEKFSTNVYTNYDVSDNYALQNSTSVEYVQSVVNYLANALSVLQYNKMNMTMRGLPFIQAGDNVRVIDSSNVYITCLMRQRVKGIQSLICDVENT